MGGAEALRVETQLRWYSTRPGSGVSIPHIVYMAYGSVRGANCGDYREVSARGVIVRHADALARHAVWMGSVVADRDEEPASAPVLAPAGEEQRVCADSALGARCGMSFPAEEGASEAKVQGMLLPRTR